MTGIFPSSGVPPAEAINTLPDPDTVNCQELWYSTSRCEPRFDPAAANAVLAELLNVLARGEVTYDCSKLDQVQLAIRYIIQRGLQTGTKLAAGPFDYTCTLDPPLTRYNDYLTLIIVPNVSNQAAVRIDTDGRGLIPLLRNDGQQLQAADLRANIPALISYFAGNWYHVGLCPSQVPIIVNGALDFWIRPDGNDTTGDGTANTAAKAFQTIAGCWAAVGSRFAATPSFSINMRLGVPATYAGAVIGPFGGVVRLYGDLANPAGYKLTSIPVGNGRYGNIALVGVAFYEIVGVTLQLDMSAPPVSVVIVQGSTCYFRGCIFDILVSNNRSTVIDIFDSDVRFDGSSGNTVKGNMYINGFGNTVSNFFTINSATMTGCWNPAGMNFYFSDLKFSTVQLISQLAVVNWQGITITSSAVTGKTYDAGLNSVLVMQGQTPPGSITGTVSTGAQFIP